LDSAAVLDPVVSGDELALGLAGAEAGADDVFAGTGELVGDSSGAEHPTVTARAIVAAPMAKGRTNELVENCMKDFPSGVCSADYGADFITCR